MFALSRSPRHMALEFTTVTQADKIKLDSPTVTISVHPFFTEFGIRQFSRKCNSMATVNNQEPV